MVKEPNEIAQNETVDRLAKEATKKTVGKM